MQQPMLSKPDLEIPEDIICPITSQIMTDPVILVESGNTYEREAILKWLKTKKSDPLTNEPITEETIAPNRTVKRMIVSFLDKNKAKNPDIAHETYLPESLIETLLAAMQRQDPKGLMETLQKDARLLTHPLKEKKNLWLLACESANLELLTVIVDKLGAGIQTLEAVKSDRGQSLFLKVSRRLGLSGATVMAKALGWEPSDVQGVLNLAVQNDEVALAGIALSLGAVATMDLLNAAYAQKKTEIVKVLLAANFTLLKEVDSQGNDFLLRSLSDGMNELTLFLLKQGKDHVNPNQQNQAKQSALHVAMESKPIDLGVVDALLSHPRINVNQVNGQQETALHRATHRGDLPCVERLIKAGISLNAKNQHGKTALDMAYDRYDPADFGVLKCLILSGAELDDVLLKAIASNQSEFIQFLLSEAQERVNPTITDVAGNPALLLAIEKNQLETVSWLLNHPKMNPGQTDPAGNTGLHTAAMLGHRAILELLMKYGLSIKAKNKDKKTPMQLAMEKGHVELANWMQERHRHKKLEPFLKPLQEKLEEQKQANKTQAVEIHKQAIEIQSQKMKLEQQEKVHQEQIQSLTRENEKLREALRKLEENVNKQSTVLGNLSIFSEKYAQSLMTVAEKAQRKQEERQREPKKLLSYPEQVEQMSEATKAQSKIQQAEVQALLKWVTEGHLLEVESLLKKNLSLGVCTGTVTDRSDRTFKGITALQYAAWSLDEEMCALIMRYIGDHNSKIQLKAWYDNPSQYSEHGDHYDIQPLIEKTQTYVKNWEKWWNTNRDEVYRYWQKEVGGEQRKCPAWLIYAWSEEGDDVAWTSQDFSRKIKREYEKHRLAWWFTENYNNGRGVGSAWGVNRGKAFCLVRLPSCAGKVLSDSRNMELLGARGGEFLVKLKSLSEKLNVAEITTTPGKKQ